MKTILVALFLLLLITSCTNEKNKRQEAQDFIPQNTTIAFKIRNLDAVLSDKKNNDLWPFLSQNEGLQYLNRSLTALEFMRTDNAVVVAINTSKANDSVNYTYITQYKDSLFTKDSLSPKVLNSSIFKSNTIKTQEINNQLIFSTVIDSFFVATSHQSELERLIENDSKATHFEGAQSLTSNASLSYYYKAQSAIKNDKALPSNLLGNFIVTDIDLSQSNIKIDGITKAPDSTQNVVSYMANTIPQENNIIKIIPNTSRSFTSYTFNNLNTVKANFNTFNNIDSLENNEHNDLIIEIGQFSIDDRKNYMLRSIDANTLKDVLNESSERLEDYRQIKIYKTESSELVADLFSPFFTKPSITHHAFIEDFIVFTNSLEDIRSIISNHSNKTTINTSAAYKSIADDISTSSTFLHFNHSKYLDPIIASNFPSGNKEDSTKIDLKNNYAQVLQMTNDYGFSHINSSIKDVKKKARTNSISEEFTIPLDNDILSEPQFVKNSTTGRKEIIVQDIENNLYLISSKGKILWKKQINGNVLGRIEQIDTYKNGRLQFVFATSNRIYVLDKNGKNVSPFPLKFNDEITQPLSVFDYDKKKSYRLLVVQGKNTIMYDIKGKTVGGFTHKSASNTITSQPKHFRVGSKDYIVFAAGKDLKILNRKGQTRIDIKQPISFSNNPILLYKNNFTTTNTDGQLIQIDQKGRVNKQNLLLPKDHNLAATSKTLVTLAENKLTIKSKSIELDFGDYTAPKIFYLNDKIYVSVTDLQTQKVYLFDSQTKLLPNFPVYGNSSLELANIDKDKNLEFVTQGESNSIILYKMN